MSDAVNEKGSPIQTYERPTGLKGLYYHPATQVVMLGLVCFMCPGLFNALNGLGGGGQVNKETGANANSALYATFATCAFFAGSINNKLGPRLTLLIGTSGYALFVGSYLFVPYVAFSVFNTLIQWHSALNIHPNATGFVIGAGAILGICAGLLWTAQGSLMMAYPTEAQKGTYIAIFWGIFNLGGVVGASVALGQNIHSKTNAVGNGTYIGFLILTSIGVFIPFLMVDPNKMIRTDGTKVTTPRHPSWKTEIVGLYIALKNDPMILLLFPMFLASNWFYTWQFNDYNGAIFNIRARALNNLIYWVAQIIGSLVMGLLLDLKQVNRRARAFAGWAILFVFVFVVHIWAFFYQRQYTRENPGVPIDISDSAYTAKVFLYIFCGLLDAMWQTTVYWLMGAMSNDPAKLAYFAGFYKSIQSAGAAGVWRADGEGISYMNIFISTWVILVSGLVFALPMIYLRVKNTTGREEETFAADSNEKESI